jgi:hypothetical protein
MFITNLKPLQPNTAITDDLKFFSHSELFRETKQDKEVAACSNVQMESEARMLGGHSDPCDAGHFDMPVISLYPRAFAHQPNRTARCEQQQQQSCVSSFTIG